MLGSIIVSVAIFFFSSSSLALSPLQKYFIRPKKKQVILEILKEINKKKDNVCSFFITHIYH